jgi:hypothetical protein
MLVTMSNGEVKMFYNDSDAIQVLLVNKVHVIINGPHGQHETFQNYPHGDVVTLVRCKALEFGVANFEIKRYFNGSEFNVHSLPPTVY